MYSAFIKCWRGWAFHVNTKNNRCFSLQIPSSSTDVYTGRSPTEWLVRSVSLPERTTLCCFKTFYVTSATNSVKPIVAKVMHALVSCLPAADIRGTRRSHRSTATDRPPAGSADSCGGYLLNLADFAGMAEGDWWGCCWFEKAISGGGATDRRDYQFISVKLVNSSACAPNASWRQSGVCSAAVSRMLCKHRMSGLWLRGMRLRQNSVPWFPGVSSLTGIVVFDVQVSK